MIMKLKGNHLKMFFSEKKTSLFNFLGIKESVLLSISLGVSSTMDLGNSITKVHYA